MSDISDRLAAVEYQLSQLQAEAAATAGMVQTGVALTDYFKPARALYETIPRYSASASGFGLTTGQILYTGIGLPANFVVSQITFVTIQVGGAATAPTHQWCSLSDGGFNQLATSDDLLTDPWPTDTPKTFPITATAAGVAPTFTTTYTGLHYLGISMTMGGSPSFWSGVTPFLWNEKPALCAQGDSGLTSPQAFPYSPLVTPSPQTTIVYAYVS